MENGLKNMRKRARLTQAQLAELVDVSQVHIANLEDGRNPLNLKRVQQFAKILGCSEPDVWGYSIPKDNVPIIEWNTASLFTQAIFVAEMIEGNLELAVIDGDATGKFALRLNDNSMNKVAPKGSVIIVDTLDRKITDTNIYIFSTRDKSRTIFRIFDHKNKRLVPSSHSDEYEIEPFTSDKADWFIVGKVVSMQKKF